MERVYNREAVLGRDATSVFPTEIAAAAAAERSAAAEAIGGRTFITESEVSAHHLPTLCSIVFLFYLVSTLALACLKHAGRLKKAL